MIKILWLVLLFLLVRQTLRLASGVQQRMRAKSMPRSEAGGELDIVESDIIDAEFTEVGDDPARDESPKSSG